jgi:F420-dependent oxidoreductase-like protein
MKVCLMIEGQEGVTWPQWIALARACEESGLEGLFRSDHYLSAFGDEERGSLDAWATLAGLAAVTERIRLGTMVSPVTFRHPSQLAKVVVTVDHISGGRVELGLGAGWYEDEHAAYGFPFPELTERYDILEEQLEIVTAHWTEEEFDFDGAHYTLERCTAEPKPLQRPRPTLIMGGAAGPRALALAGEYADEYNVVYLTPERAAEVREKLPEHVRLSYMTSCVVGRTRTEVIERARAVLRVTGDDTDPVRYIAERAEGRLIGTVDEIAAALRRYRDAGVERVFLQHLAHEDVEMVRLIGRELVPALA